MSKIQYMLFLTALLSLLSVETMFSQTYEFNTSGNTVSFPTGTVLKVEAWGGGGRGGTRTGGSNSYGGGGGGAYASSIITVTETSAYWVNVGSGSSNNSNPGGDSWFSTNNIVNNALVLAKGGSSVPNNITTGAAGGYYDDCIGDIRNNGGRGADGDHSTGGHGGGGGGSSAGATGVGVNATNNFGAVGPSGYDGIGGNGSNDNGNGSSGSIPGGGGGGAQRTGGSSTGGNGANGRVIITVLGPELTITQTGTTQWIAPEGVTVIEVAAWGAGGRGGQRSNNGRGGGGGGGAYSRGLIAVTPGQTYYINTGAGSTSTAAGGSSWFNASNSAPDSDNYVLAAGGNSAPNNNNNGAFGGSLNSGYGNQEKRSGGNGANSTGSSTGGGGASAGPGANGGNASGGMGGTAPTGGGNGANGHNQNTNGNPGLTPGGGGSGARRDSNTTRFGGAGANGQVIIRTLDLSVSKSVVGNNTTPLVGSNITFTITATNNSTSTVSGINVTDVLPSGFTYVSNNGGATHNSGTVTWDVGSLAPSASASLQLTVEVNASGSYANTATLNIDVGDTNVAVSSDRITLFPQQPATNLQLTKEVDNAMPLISEEVVFTLTVYNGGPQNATGVEVVDILPFGLSHVSNSGGYDSTTGIWTIGSLNNGATATLMLTAKVNPTGNHYNQAVVSGNEFDPDLTNNSSGTQVYPTYPLTEIVLSCATMSYDLTGFTIGTPPPGAEISWHTASPADDTNKITTPTSVRAGETYYVAFYDPIELCYGSTSEVKITRSCLISNPMIRQRVK